MDKYEKLYNEALERFKSFKEKYYTKDTNLGDVIFDKNGEMQKDFNGIFPELRESEDERIRKHLVAIVEMYWGKTNDPDKAKELAYLERQKEQKPNYCHHEVDETGWTEEYRKAYYDGWNNCNIQHEQLKEEQKCKYQNGFVSSDGSFYPVWNEEDEHRREGVVEWLRDHQKTIDRNSNNQAYESIESLISWLKSLRPSWKPSEEQMNALNNAVHKLAKTDVADSVRLSIMYDNLKKLI